jgi:signal transduction histidine kinase
MADVGVVVLLSFLSWAAGRELFSTGFNTVDGEHLNVAAWWITSSVVGLGFVVFRRWLPETALALAAAATALHAAQGWPLLPFDLVGAMCLYAVAVRRPRLVSAAWLIAALGAAYAATGWTVVGYRSPLPVPLGDHGDFPSVALLLVLIWFAGTLVAGARAREARLQAAADEQAEAATMERARISREVHDVVAHGLSVMVVQAQGGAAALGTQPDRTQAALDAIVATGRSSLAEMRRLLEGDTTEAAGTAELAPLPGVSRLPELVESVSSAGLPTTFQFDGPDMSFPSSIDLSVYRIVQEALTNAIRHAGPGAMATVRVTVSGDQVEIDVTDSGRGLGDGAPGAGHGLVGIRERVSSLNGDLCLGPGPNGGFQVHAVLPISSDRT